MLYPMKLDPAHGRVLQIEMDEAAFRAASFLDDRMLTPATKGAWAPLPAVMAESETQPGTCPLHFIFHTGHVGSTLVSRLLDETGQVLSLREPLPLRSLAALQDEIRWASPNAPDQAQLDALFAMFARLWRRGFAGNRAIILKATSSSARVAPQLLNTASEAKAIYLNLRPEPWLATLLAGENSSVDLKGHGPERLRRLGALLQSPLPSIDSLSAGELAAVSWLAETSTQLALLRSTSGRVLPVDFDAFLANVPVHMQRILMHFNLPQDAQFLAGITRSPVLTRYSKAPEHPYDPGLRNAVLNDSRMRNRNEIVSGMRLLEKLVRTEPGVAALFAAKQ